MNVRPEPADTAGPVRIAVPNLSLVVLIGPSGAGKTTFARRHFKPTEVVSSDACRAMISDDETDQSVTPQAFRLLHQIADERLALGRLTVVDATSVRPEARRPLVHLARQHHAVPVAVVLNLPEAVCLERLRRRPDRDFGPNVIHEQHAALVQSSDGLRREGFWHVFTLNAPEEVEAAVVERVPLPSDRRDDSGPFDAIGDVHGCCDELEELLTKLGYEPVAVAPDPVWGGPTFAHPAGRKVVFVGDLVDRGPRVLDAVRVVRNMVAGGSALCVPGNHDDKLRRWLEGRDVRVAHGLAESIAEVEALPADVRGAFQDELARFLGGLVSHYVLDGGRLVVAHAGLPRGMHGRASAGVRDFALYGDVTGETDELGLPVRGDWAAGYDGPAAVVYGHTPVPEPVWRNGTVNIDTGCVFGGKLTAVRWPEREFVSVPARRVYCVPRRPFLPHAASVARSLPLDPEDEFASGIFGPDPQAPEGAAGS